MTEITQSCVPLYEVWQFISRRAKTILNMAFADMSVKATEALMYAQELGLNDEAYSDMFGAGTPCAGSFIGRTDIIEHMLEGRRNGRQTEN